jgi:hypothetical protein
LRQDLIENDDLEVANKAYDADALIDGLAEREITPVIPPKANRRTKRDGDFATASARTSLRQPILKSWLGGRDLKSAALGRRAPATRSSLASSVSHLMVV